jgi:hypothetical protein
VSFFLNKKEPVMSNTSTLVEPIKLPKLKKTENHKVRADNKQPVKGTTHSWLRRRIYREFIETNKAILIICVYLAVYMVTGLHGWWTQLVAKLV